MIPILGTFLTLFVGGHPVHFWVINSYNWQLFGNYHFSDQFVLKITPYKRDLGVKVDIFDPQLELKIHFWVINNWESAELFAHDRVTDLGCTISATRTVGFI